MPPDASSASPAPGHDDGVVEAAAAQYMDDLAARLLEESEPRPAPADPELDSTTAASLEKFMASLKEHLQLAPGAWTDGALPGDVPAAAATPPPPRERAHARTAEEHRARVAEVVRQHMHEEAHGVPPGASPLMTRIKCLHASVAQKSYGSEKRFLCPPPIVQVTGTLRYAPSTPLLLMQVQSEDGDSLSGEQLASLDETSQARFTELHVTGTGKAKSFRLLLHALVPRDGSEPTKRLRLGGGSAALVRGPSWASLESAPIGIISKPSKRIAKARNISAHITKEASVSLFNRINSQTYRTKYLCAQDGRLSAQSRAWTAFRLVVLSRREAACPHESIDENVLSYGSVIMLVDPPSGVATDPLIVCKVDRGRILPPVDGHAAVDDDELSAWGAVTQMQKVALLRFVPGEQGWGLPASAPRAYLCAGARSADDAGRVDGPADDARLLPLTFAAARPAAPASPSHAPVDEAEDAFCWTLVGISHFEYAFIDVDMLDVPGPTTGMGLALTPFPLVTTMPYYDAPSHKLVLTVQHFFYVNDSAALQTPKDALAAARAPHAARTRLEIWLGPLGPLPLASVPLPDSDETDVAVQMPSLKAILGERRETRDLPTQCTLPLLFVRGHDSTIYHSGRHVLCQDLVAVVRAAGDAGAANALQKLHVGLGEQAGAHELPPGGVWTLRVV